MSSLASLSTLLESRKDLQSCRESARHERDDLGHAWAAPHVSRLDQQLDELEEAIARCRDVDFAAAVHRLADANAGALGRRLAEGRR